VKSEIIKRVEALSRVMGSKKRILLLMSIEDSEGYSKIVSKLKSKFNTLISSSEFYKHVRELEDGRMISIRYSNPDNRRSWRKFFVTEKGKMLIDVMEMI